MSTDAILADFPNLARSNWRITSDVDAVYNCIAWAVECTNDWWWPEPDKYWPSGVPREETVEAFLAAFASVGFIPCENGNLEAGLQKIALFAFDDQPTHAARQLLNGRWTSKLGKGHDIEHDDLAGLSGALYGFPVRFLKKNVKTP